MLEPIWNPFSRYADRQEKRVDKLLKRMAFIGVFEAQRILLEMMQKNMVILNLFLEWKFKGYKYLKKSARKRMYRNAENIGTAFLNYANTVKVDEAALLARLKSLGLSAPAAPPDLEKLKYFALIMGFLKPGQASGIGRDGGERGPGNYYQYLEGASFGKLLVDIESGRKMIGDCNQIVTFYVYLYSLRHDLRELQIKLPKGHVCLHFKGIDIEATAGSFAKYTEYEWLLPIVELVSTNLLDVSDFRDKQLKIDPREYLKGSQLAFNISSQREIVARNLSVSYYNLAIESMKSEDFETAEFFMEKSGKNDAEGRQLMESIYHNAVVYYVKTHNFSKARYFAGKSGEGELKKYVDEREGSYYYEQGSLARARELFSAAGNSEMVKATYGKEYNQVQARVKGINDLATMKSHRSDYEKMLDLAYKMNDQGLIDNLHNVLKQL
jgi:hypothetical protein